MSPRGDRLEMVTHLGTLEAMIVSAVGVREDSVLVLETSVTPDWRVVYGREGTSEGPGGWRSRASESVEGFRGRKNAYQPWLR